MTLLEVVAALALLASLLAAVVLAKARYARQAAAADRRMQAVAAADALLGQWHQNPRSLPEGGSGSGMVDGDVALSWRTHPLTNPGIEDLGGRVVRVEVVDERAAPRPVLVEVEFVVDPRGQSATTGATKPATRKPPKHEMRK